MKRIFQMEENVPSEPTYWYSSNVILGINLRIPLKKYTKIYSGTFQRTVLEIAFLSLTLERNSETQKVDCLKSEEYLEESTATG